MVKYLVGISLLYLVIAYVLDLLTGIKLYRSNDYPLPSREQIRSNYVANGLFGALLALFFLYILVFGEFTYGE